MASTASRGPRRAFFVIAALLAITWGSQTAEREALRRAATTYDLGIVEGLMNVITAVDVVLGLGLVVALLVLCLAPRSARVTFPAQLAATLTALGVLVRGGVRLLLASGAFAATATFARYGAIVVTLADIAVSMLLLVVIGRVARAAKAHVAFAFGIVANLLVLARLIAYGLPSVVSDSATVDTLDQVQRWVFLGYELLLLWLCVHAGVVVTRVPDELPA